MQAETASLATRSQLESWAAMSRQPFGQMPALDDDGFVLYETHAMCRYLNDRAGGSLMPRDLRVRAAADQWMSVESANFSSHAMTFVYHYLLTLPHEPSVLEHAAAAFDTTLGVLSAQLSKQLFVADQNFTLAAFLHSALLGLGSIDRLRNRHGDAAHRSARAHAVILQTRL
jgi:glutathione S-transferase